MASDIRAKFGERIRELRQRRKWSQERLAEIANLHPSYISGIERGSRNVSLKNIQKLANALGVPLSALFESLD